MKKSERNRMMQDERQTEKRKKKKKKMTGQRRWKTSRHLNANRVRLKNWTKNCLIKYWKWKTRSRETFHPRNKERRVLDVEDE